MKITQTKKKQFEESEYTINKKQKETFASLLKRIGINEWNYTLITINSPDYITDWQKQLKYFERRLKRIKINFVACLEWSDKRAHGYHLHLIISSEDIDLLDIPKKTGHKSELLVNNCLDRCIGYLSKERRGCVVNEKEYYTNINERKLVPVAIRSITTVEAPVEVVEEHNVPVLNEPKTKPKKELKVFFTDLIKKVKIVISRLFIRNKEQHYYDYTKEIVC